MKKMGYKEEYISFKECFSFILAMTILFLCFLEDFSFLLSLFVLVCFCIFGVYYFWSKHHHHQKNIRIKNEGLACPAIIINYEKYQRKRCKWPRLFRLNIIRYYLYIKYIHPITKEVLFYHTPEINFHPDELGSKVCKVYLYNGEVYATEFAPRTEKQKAIWYTQDELDQKMEQSFKRNLIFIIIFFLFILFMVFN